MMPLTNLFTAFLAFQLPGIEQVTGLPGDYFPKEAMDIAIYLHKIIFHDAQILAFSLLIITGAIVAISSYSGKNFSLQETTVKVFGAFFLLYTINFSFGWTMQIGTAIASDIMTPKDILSANAEFKQIAKIEEKNTASNIVSGITNVFAGGAVSLISHASTALIVGSLYALIIAIFFIVIQLTMILWKTLAMILYIFAPLCIALGVVPEFGTRILCSWYGAVVQLSAWQIWIAVCAYFIKFSSVIYFSSYNPTSTNFLDPTVQVTAVGVALMFIILAVLGPLFIGKLIPTSDFTAAGAAGITFVTSKVFSAVTNTVASGAKAVASGGAAA